MLVIFSVIIWETQSVLANNFFVSHPLLFKNFTDLQQLPEIKKNFALAKTRNARKFKNLRLCRLHFCLFIL